MQLQRITSSSKWIPEIDGLRFIAIVSVLLIHVLGETMTRDANRLPDLHQYMWFIHHMYLLGRGVQLFFVISGFILAQPFVRHYLDGGTPVRLRAFYLRRVTRLEPPYLLSLILYAGVLVMLRGFALKPMALALLSCTFYVHNLFQRSLPPINFVTWSLEVEIIFYLLSPLLACIFLIHSSALRRGILVAAILIDVLIPMGRFDHAGFYFPGQLCFFLVGYLLADLRIHQRPLLSHRLWDVASFALWMAVFFFPEFLFTRAVLCLLLFAAFSASMFGPLTRRFLGLRWIALIGGMCYSIYLMHMIIISAFFSLTQRLLIFRSLYTDYLVHLVLSLPVIVGGSMLYYIAIERPCMDPAWPRKLLDRLHTARAAAAKPPSR